jgi:Type II secretory pathway, component PulJ
MADGWRNRGTTLLEVLLALGLSSLLVGLLLMVYTSSSNAYQTLAAYADAQYTARSIMGQIGDDIRGAPVIETAAGGAELRVTAYNHDIIRYQLEGDQLYRLKTTGSGTAKVPIAEKVSAIRFEASNGLITTNVEITIDQTSYRLNRVFGSRLIQQEAADPEGLQQP